jgi:hypothetical protein
MHKFFFLCSPIITLTKKEDRRHNPHESPQNQVANPPAKKRGDGIKMPTKCLQKKKKKETHKATHSKRDKKKKKEKRTQIP